MFFFGGGGAHIFYVPPVFTLPFKFCEYCLQRSLSWERVELLELLSVRKSNLRTYTFKFLQPDIDVDRTAKYANIYVVELSFQRA